MTKHTFQGAVDALRFLRDEGFQMGVNMSAPWTTRDKSRTAYVFDEARGVSVVVDAAHLPVKAVSAGAARYSFRNWSQGFVCPVCGHSRRYNTNFLGQRDVICDGSGRFDTPLKAR